jgi:uncharacterized damage-inducible protein DinB
MTSIETVPNSLITVYDGWEGYNTSLVHAVEPLTPAQLAWRPAPNLRSVGEVVRHISLGRVTWFTRMGAPGSAQINNQIKQSEPDSDGNVDVVEESVAITENAAEQVRWLNLTWSMIEATLKTWPVSDLTQTYRHKWNGDLYNVSRQWTIWRILAHDIQHGGELSLMLGMQGLEAFELGPLGGHITLPPLAQPLP